MKQLPLQIHLCLKEHLIEMMCMVIRIEGSVWLLMIPGLDTRNDEVLGASRFRRLGRIDQVTKRFKTKGIFVLGGNRIQHSRPLGVHHPNKFRLLGRFGHGQGQREKDKSTSVVKGAFVIFDEVLQLLRY